ncbi:MAG TPA: OsmC family protein [Arachidicoccus soli]|nr:OsmC family protein [Arachidicoccus soli]
MKRSASAIWNGSIKEGNGKLTTQSTTLNNTQYSFQSRFEEGVGTNPEELIAAAHAGCFAMALSNILGAEGFTPESLNASATITMDPEKLELTDSHIVLKAKIPGISQEKFEECTQKAKAGCPISKVLNLNISLDTSLI